MQISLFYSTIMTTVLLLFWFTNNGFHYLILYGGYSKIQIYNRVSGQYTEYRRRTDWPCILKKSKAWIHSFIVVYSCFSLYSLKWCRKR